jgi:hypothetical protein
MRRYLLAASLVAVAAALVIGAAASASDPSGSSPAPAQPVLTAAPGGSQRASDVLAARLATAKYANNLDRAKTDGYHILTTMIPNMGIHFINPSIAGFDVTKPPILVYEHHGDSWQLGALEWVFTSMPAKPPLPGATYGVFGAACHYVDGTFVFANSQSKCALTSPTTGAKFNFWHPRLVTLHFWIWYPNPSGIYTGTNPLVAPFNNG